MHAYLIDRETLGQFVDSLITQKFPGQPAENLTRLREVAMAALDNRIGTALFGSLSLEAHDEIDALLNDPDTPPDAFRAFFEKYHLDPEKQIKQTMQSFQDEFLKGVPNA